MSDASDDGSVLVLSAPSGAGKTTLCRRLLDGIPDLEFSVSHTTRPPREGEREGIDYHFVSQAAFEALRDQGGFLEWARVADHLYGTAHQSVRATRSRGHDVLLDIDTQGGAAVRRAIPEAVLIFLLPPGPDALRSRLEGRGSETPESLARRLSLARGEVEQAHLYDYLVVNDELDAAFDRLRSIVLSVRSRTVRQTRRLESIRRRFAGPTA